MKSDNREIEVKFPVRSVKEYGEKIIKLGAVCEQPEQFERNLRFDTKKQKLSKSKQVLRLRDNGGRSILTFKADNNSTDELADREEIETVVEDFDKMQLILERLGFEVCFIYEKYRSIYSLCGAGIFLDHTPIGDFIEIEGADEEAIRRSAEQIGLSWETRIGRGYRALFNTWKEQNSFDGRDMTFADIIPAERHS